MIASWDHTDLFNNWRLYAALELSLLLLLFIIHIGSSLSLILLHSVIINPVNLLIRITGADPSSLVRLGLRLDVQGKIFVAKKFRQV